MVCVLTTSETRSRVGYPQSYLRPSESDTDDCSKASVAVHFRPFRNGFLVPLDVLPPCLVEEGYVRVYVSCYFSDPLPLSSKLFVSRLLQTL